jgi:hypothetical protein
MVEGASLNGVILQILNEKLDDGRVLVKGRFANQKSISVKRNKVTPYLGSQHFVVDQLRRLHTMGWEKYSESLQEPGMFRGKREIYRSPTNVEMIGWIVKLALEKLSNRLTRSAVVSHWRIGIRRRDGDFLRRLECGLVETDYQWFESPKGHFWADPILCEFEDKTYLFFEDYCYQERRAVIACGEVSDDLTLSNIMTVLDTGGHASFPFVFRDGDNFYMVPETCEDGTVSLYEAVNFPNEWKRLKVLINLACVDSILWKQGGLWWLHTSYNFNHGHAHTALLYSCETLLGEWQLHREAPFAPDVRYARNAGPVICTENGKHFRVSQSSEFSYGSSFTFHEIDEINNANYRETVALTVPPSSNSDRRGSHSFTLSEKFEVVDGVWNELVSDVT